MRVTSLYDLCASFIFQPTSKDQGDGGPQDLPNLMHFWIENEQCIPGFLANVALECYDKSKQEGGTSNTVVCECMARICLSFTFLLYSLSLGYSSAYPIDFTGRSLSPVWSDYKIQVRVCVPCQ